MSRTETDEVRGTFSPPSNASTWNGAGAELERVLEGNQKGQVDRQLIAKRRRCIELCRFRGKERWRLGLLKGQ